ncbi:MAG: imidazoleglycerol-phosphate dehydratase [Planctomycetota bacterium]|jgi:imidazoleglycerol-phosphate dehydratase
MTRLNRKTKETTITLALDGNGGAVRVETGDRFLTHMVETLARYAGLGLELEAEGDLRHHLVEDVGIALGAALMKEAPKYAARYGSALVPMDEALVQAAVDVGGRPYYVGPLPSRLYEHFLQSLAMNLGATLHIKVIRGKDRHHMVEAAVKAFGLALRQALQEGGAVFSTKGSVEVTWGEE